MPGRIEGKVTAVTPAGDLVTDIPVGNLADAPRDERTTVTCDEHVTQGLFAADHQEPPMTFLALLGAGGFLELVIVGDSAKIMLGIRPGQPVVVSW
ncbi:MAG TPA: adenosylmethionine-8-amino-7-oxononanoate aminotransferase [Pirellulaceae bacterium]|nr:adenosylmethionine-8-amino-7-oxononanoate aminotransferase [Pirellulaceae bacterium]